MSNLAVLNPGFSLVPSASHGSGHERVPLRLVLRTSGEETSGTLVVDQQAHEAVINGRSVELTAKEFSLLRHFAEHAGHVLSRKALLAGIWGEGYTGGMRTVDIHVSRLRAKLGTELPLFTVRRVGYKLRARAMDEQV